MNKRTYRQFSPEFKREAVPLVEKADSPITHVARKLGIRVNQIYKWRRQIKPEINGVSVKGQSNCRVTG